MTSVRIRDLTTRDVHEIAESTPALAISVADREDWTSRNPTGLDVPDNELPTDAVTVAEIAPRQWAYVCSTDEGDTPGSVVWWLSERMP